MALSKTFLKFIKNNRKVGDWYHDGTYYDVRMKGYCDDHNQGRHVIIDRVASEVVVRVKRATPCKCVECCPKQEA